MSIPLILASASPRRKDLLSMAGIPFTIQAMPTDETIQAGTSPEDAVCQLALRKSQAVAHSNPTSAVLAADTIVALQGTIFGKPATRGDAFSMLSRLSGQTHQVFTGVCLLLPDGTQELFFERTDVVFYPLTAQEINAYIATGEPMDKAGAYGIQGKGAILVKQIQGDFYNVVGLPLARVIRTLRKYPIL